MRTRHAAVAALAAALVLVAACSGGGDDDAGDDDPSATTNGGDGPDDPGDCIVVDMAVSSEKITLLGDLADSFNSSDGAKVNGRCVFVRPRSVASGLAATLIPQEWPNPDVNGEPPVIWSPASSGWAGIVNARAGREMAPAGTPFMLTPLVIAMPKPMAEALGLAEHPARLQGPAAAGPEPGGLGVGWPPRVGAVPPRQDQPQLLDERAQLHDRRVLRGRRQDAGPDVGGPGSASSRRLRPPDRVVRRPLRRHHDDVPQQLVRRRRPRHRADLCQRRGRRGEERHRLQQGQPRRRPLPR